MGNTPLNPQTQGQDTTQTRAESPPFIQTREVKSVTSKPGLNTFLTGVQQVNRQVGRWASWVSICPPLQKKNGGIVMVSLSVGVMECNLLANVSTVAGKAQPGLSVQF